MSFPAERPRRLRRSEALRNLVRETLLTTQGLVYPMFVCPGSKVCTEVSSMPGVYQQSVDQLVEECREVESLGVPAVILFGLPKQKDARGSEAVSASGVVQRAIEGIRKAKLKLLVITSSLSFALRMPSIARCTTPEAETASDPRASFCFGRPNRITAGTPSDSTSRHSSTN